VFLATLGADEAQIEASFCEAIRIAREQKSISLATRAEGTAQSRINATATYPFGGVTVTAIAEKLPLDLSQH
jgi:hypothetical protein